MIGLVLVVIFSPLRFRRRRPVLPRKRQVDEGEFFIAHGAFDQPVFLTPANNPARSLAHAVIDFFSPSLASRVFPFGNRTHPSHGCLGAVVRITSAEPRPGVIRRPPGFPPLIGNAAHSLVAPPGCSVAENCPPSHQYLAKSNKGTREASSHNASS